MNQHYPGQTTIVSLVPRILGAIPDHDQYWELFCGTCQIFQRKNPVPSILVDKNRDVVDIALAGFENGCRYQYLHSDVFEVLNSLLSTGSYLEIELSPAAFVYMDPPWRISKLGQKKPLYEFNLSDEQTADLLNLAVLLPCKTAILHYRDELYDEILKGWYRLDTQVSYRGRVCDISLYCNYDFRAVRVSHSGLAGIDRTDRQRIKRKAQRWLKNFETLPMYERQAIFEAIKNKF